MGVNQAEGCWAPSRKKGRADRGAGGPHRGGGNDALLVILLTFDIIHVALYAALQHQDVKKDTAHSALTERGETNPAEVLSLSVGCDAAY